MEFKKCLRTPNLRSANDCFWNLFFHLDCSFKNQFRKIDKKTPKKRFKHRCFLVNFPNFLKISFLKNLSDGCFTINTRSVYCPTTTYGLFKNNAANIFCLSIFTNQLVGWEQEWAQYLKPLSRSLFLTQSNIYDGAFFAKIVQSWKKPLSIFRKKASFMIFNQALNKNLWAATKRCSKVKN